LSINKVWELMAARFVTIDHDTPLLLPPDLRDWVPANHLVHFVMDAVCLLNLNAAQTNERGTGSAQYPPSMMLGLLIYSYCTGTFSSRKIEKLTHDSVPVRFLCADTHPDHDSICKFRRENKALLASAFHQILECAARAQILKVGDITISIDGTKILASASKHSAMSYGHAAEQMKLLEEEIGQLLAKAEEADSTPLQDGLSIPEEIRRREDRMTKIKLAMEVIEARAKERLAEESVLYQSKLEARKAKEEATGKKPGGKEPKPPQEGPSSKDQYNFTDPESRIMKAGNGQHFEQAYNAQAAVEIESRLIVGQHLVDAPNDKEQLVPAMAAITPVVESVAAVLVDNGYYSEAAVTKVESQSSPKGRSVVYAATKQGKHGRRMVELEDHPDPPPPLPDASAAEIMGYRLATRAGKQLYGQRKQTVEPVFGIIKETMGFRRFMLRGLAKTKLEWTLVTLSYNVKRLFHIGTELAMA
jgi:transposase